MAAGLSRSQDLSQSEIPAVAGLPGRHYALAGDRAAALREINRLKQLSRTKYVPSFYIAGIYLALGMENEGMDYLQKSYDERYEGLIYAHVDPVFDPVKDDPRFKALLHRMNLE